MFFQILFYFLFFYIFYIITSFNFFIYEKDYFEMHKSNYFMILLYLSEFKYKRKFFLILKLFYLRVYNL